MNIMTQNTINEHGRIVEKYRLTHNESYKWGSGSLESKIDRISGVLLAPMNIMTQNKINEHGIIVEKYKLTHDQSYTWGSRTLVNSRVDKDNLLPCRFGAFLKRLMNWTVAARKKFQGKKIISSKIDYKLAYR